MGLRHARGTVGSAASRDTGLALQVSPGSEPPGVRGAPGGIRGRRLTLVGFGCWLPVFSTNYRQTHLPLLVDVRVIDLRFERDLRWFEGVLCWKVDFDSEGPLIIGRVVGNNEPLPSQQISFIDLDVTEVFHPTLPDFFKLLHQPPAGRHLGSGAAAGPECIAALHHLWNLLKLMFIESVMPSIRLILCHPLLLPPSIFPRCRVFPSESTLRIRWPKYWSLDWLNNEFGERNGIMWK